MRSPAFQFYPQDFLVGTAELTAEETGCYIRLLCYQWAKGGLPKDNIKLMQLGGITDPYVLGNVVVKFGLCEDGLFRNERLEKVRFEQDEFHRKQRENGQKGGNPMFQKGKSNPYYTKKETKDNPDLSSGDNPKINSSSSSSSSNRFIVPNPKEVEEYAKSIDFKVDGEYFVSHYEKTGWKIRGSQIKSWKACVLTWKKGRSNFNGKSTSKPISGSQAMEAL